MSKHREISLSVAKNQQEFQQVEVRSEKDNFQTKELQASSNFVKPSMRSEGRRKK